LCWAEGGPRATGVLLCLTIIGIPLGLANFKLIPLSLFFGRQIVSIEQARAMGLSAGVTVLVAKDIAQ
jgi:uncharacterized membrane protein YccF (DUF307 family)